MLRQTAAAALLLALGACTVGPNFEPPDWLSPASWFAKKAEPIPKEASIPVAEPIDPNWWNLFKDPTLTDLERRVAGENLDVQVASVRIAESRAQLGVVGAAQFPTLNANGSYTREKASDVGVFAGSANALGANGAFGNSTGGIRSNHLNAFDVYQVGFDASWEVDLWGRVRRSVESASASVSASNEARRATLLSSLAELARDYVQLRGTQLQLRIARDNVRIAQQSLQLTQQRAVGGVTTDLDVANAAAQLRTTAAQIPPLEQQESELINAISLLLGLPPNALQAELIESKPVPPVPPRVP
ncbi:MAG TPA: TolC family protein, partial [Acetobacteraceae bacterium]|nr:TolC family protein [Acetobacteraceae bacterium]